MSVLAGRRLPEIRQSMNYVDTTIMSFQQSALRTASIMDAAALPPLPALACHQPPRLTAKFSVGQQC
jgi:hypothetical protein